jgi:pimeloyl-ACP methyl ester carboxylesterase
MPAMPLLIIVRFWLSMLSWVVLGASAYLLWTWYQGEEVLRPDGLLATVREDWRLWAGLGLLAWSFLGGFIVRPFLAKPDRKPLEPHRGEGEVIDGARGAKLYVEQIGPKDAPCLILTHGWGLDSTIWAYAKRELSQTFRVVVWDLPGMGRSRAGPDGVHLSAFADDLTRVIDYAGAQKVVVAGHSIGGMTIQTLARDNPIFFNDRVAGVVLINTTHTDPLKTMILSGLFQALRPLLVAQLHLTAWLEPLAFIGAWQSYLNGTAHIGNRLGFGPHVTHSQLEHVTRLITRNSQRAQALGNLSMIQWDATGALKGVSAPVLVMGGKDDIVTKPEASRAIAASTPSAGLEIIEEVNHMGFVERSEAYNRAIAAFAAVALKPSSNPTAQADLPQRHPVTV